jgi:uncharacterized SAM-binding protein YcdF (DUF218 family)
VLVIVLIGFCSLAGFLDGYGQRDQARKADAIVVLGASVVPGGMPGQVLRERTLHAVELYKRHLAPKMIFTGGVGAFRVSEASAAATLARKHGVQARDIILESRSTSTWENARVTSWICQERGWHKVVVVSDPYHLWRAKRDFEQAGLVPYVSPATAWQERYPTRRLLTAAREAVLVLRDLVVRP